MRLTAMTIAAALAVSATTAHAQSGSLHGESLSANQCVPYGDATLCFAAFGQHTVDHKGRYVSTLAGFSMQWMGPGEFGYRQRICQVPKEAVNVRRGGASVATTLAVPDFTNCFGEEFICDVNGCTYRTPEPITFSLVVGNARSTNQYVSTNNGTFNNGTDFEQRFGSTCQGFSGSEGEIAIMIDDSRFSGFGGSWTTQQCVYR